MEAAGLVGRQLDDYRPSYLASSAQLSTSQFVVVVNVNKEWDEVLCYGENVER